MRQRKENHKEEKIAAAFASSLADFLLFLEFQGSGERREEVGCALSQLISMLQP